MYLLGILVKFLLDICPRDKIAITWKEKYICVYSHIHYKVPY